MKNQYSERKNPMSVLIAEMLLQQMNESNATVTFYRGQRYSKLYLRRVIWRANCYEDHRQAMKQAGKVCPL